MLKFRNFLSHLADEALKPFMLCNEKLQKKMSLFVYYLRDQ